LLGASLTGAGIALAAAGIGGGPARQASAAILTSVPKRWDAQADLVSLGASCGGLMGAIRGHDFGMKTMLLEVGNVIGGGTAVSNGGMWIPLTSMQKEAGYPDSKEIVIDYIRSTSFGRHDEEKLAAYLDNGAEAVAYANAQTSCKIVGSIGGDYFTQDSNSRPGRAVWPDLENGARIMANPQRYPLFAKVRKPYIPMSVGGQKGVTAELGGGNALIGSLVASCTDRNIPILMNTRAMRLITENGRVIGVHALKDGKDFYVRANRAVLIAVGGFEHNQDMHRMFSPINAHVYSGVPPTNVGDGHIMGMEVGAAIGLMDLGVWMAALQMPGEQYPGIPWQQDGSTIVFYPGQIVVNRDGKRFCDESFYPAVPKGFMVPPTDKESQFPNWPAFVIMDQAVRDKFEFGDAPKGTEMRKWLYRADTLRELAGQIGVNPDGLEQTVKQFNADSARGVDSLFGRGSDNLNPIVLAAREKARRATAGATVAPYYVEGFKMGTLQKPPFYAAKLGIGTEGTRGGLITNPQCQVIDVRGDVIPGLYATSNAAAQLAVGGSYTSGMSIGQSFVFGYLAAKHVAGKDKQASAG